MNPFEFRRQTYHAKSCDVSLLFSENHVILSSVVLSQFIRVTDDTQITLATAELSNAIAKFGQKAENDSCCYKRANSLSVCGMLIRSYLPAALSREGINFSHMAILRFFTPQSDSTEHVQTVSLQPNYISTVPGKTKNNTETTDGLLHCFLFQTFTEIRSVSRSFLSLFVRKFLAVF